MLTGVLGLTYKRMSDEEKLIQYLFQEYNPSARPVLNSSKTVNIGIQFSLIQIQELVSNLLLSEVNCNFVAFTFKPSTIIFIDTFLFVLMNK